MLSLQNLQIYTEQLTSISSYEVKIYIHLYFYFLKFLLYIGRDQKTVYVETILMNARFSIVLFCSYSVPAER